MLRRIIKALRGQAVSLSPDLMQQSMHAQQRARTRAYETVPQPRRGFRPVLCSEALRDSTQVMGRGVREG